MKKAVWNIGFIGVQAVVIGGVILSQGCGTMQGPAALPSEHPMPPTLSEDELSEPAPPAQPYRPKPMPAASVYTPAVAPASVDVPEEGVVYEIKKGDVLSVVAKRYGVTVQEILGLNPQVTDPDKIRFGQKLKMPSRVNLDNPKPVKPRASSPRQTSGDGDVYVVQAGDSLSVIAYRAGIDVSDLRTANGISGDKILVGQELIIPEGGTMPKKESAPRASSLREAPEPQPVSTLPVTSEEEAVSESLLPPEPATGDASAGVQTYTVVIGDDILSVASEFNVSIADLREANNLSSDILVPGRTLIIPASE